MTVTVWLFPRLILDLSGVEGVEVIDDRDVRLVSQERINDVAADETGAACDQYVHGGG